MTYTGTTVIGTGTTVTTGAPVISGTKTFIHHTYSPYEKEEAMPSVERIRSITVTAPGLRDKQLVHESIVSLPRGGRVARLLCECWEFLKSENSNCVHIREVVKRGFDGFDAAGNKLNLPPVLEVPITFQMWTVVPVSLSPGPFPNSQEVTVTAPFINETVSLGYIFVGQGRRDLSNLIREWLVEKGVTLSTSETFKGCPAQHHWGNLPQMNVGFQPDSIWHLINLADLLFTGQCRRCNEDAGVPDV